HDQELCAIDLDLGARPLAEQDAVAFLEVERDNLAILAASAGPYRNDLALLRFLGGGIGNEDAPGGLGFAVDAAQGHAIVEGTKFHFLGSNAVNPARGREPSAALLREARAVGTRDDGVPTQCLHRPKRVRCQRKSLWASG